MTPARVFIISNNPYLRAIAEECGCEVKTNQEDNLQEFNPNYLVAEISTQTFLSDMEQVRKAKEILPGIITIVTGTPFLTYNTNAIYENSFVDYVIVGEPEFTLRDILQGVPDNEILGICYRENFQGVKNDNRPFIENLDLLPFPAKHISPAVIEISRGCPSNCFFCLETPKVRTRSVDSIIAEIKECSEIKEFIFKGNVFDLKNLSEKIIESKLKIIWSSYICANKIDNETAALMYKSGCRFINLGIESGSQIILDNIGKKITLDEIRKTVKILKKNKIKIHNHFLIGLPWETETTVEETIKFAIELDSDSVTFNMAAPFPGTKFFAYSMFNHLCDGNMDFKNAYNAPIVKTHELSKERLSELRKQAIRRFYSRPKYILKNLFCLPSLIRVLRQNL